MSSDKKREHNPYNTLEFYIILILLSPFMLMAEIGYQWIQLKIWIKKKLNGY